MIALWFQACIYWKIVVFLTASVTVIYFSMVLSVFHGSTWSDPYVKGTVFISQHLLQPSITTNDFCLIRANMSGIMFIWGKPLQPCSFKGNYLIHRARSSNFCLKSTVLNARKLLQPSHSFMVNVLIWQCHNGHYKLVRPPKTIHDHPRPSTTSHYFTATTHDHPKTSHNFATSIHDHPRPGIFHQRHQRLKTSLKNEFFQSLLNSQTN